MKKLLTITLISLLGVVAICAPPPTYPTANGFILTGSDGQQYGILSISGTGAAAQLFVNWLPVINGTGGGIPAVSGSSQGLVLWGLSGASITFDSSGTYNANSALSVDSSNTIYIPGALNVSGGINGDVTSVTITTSQGINNLYNNYNGKFFDNYGNANSALTAGYDFLGNVGGFIYYNNSSQVTGTNAYGSTLCYPGSNTLAGGNASSGGATTLNYPDGVTALAVITNTGTFVILGDDSTTPTNPATPAGYIHAKRISDGADIWLYYFQ